MNCELKTRLTDIVSRLRNNCRQIAEKGFSTMSTACKFSDITLFIYLSLRLLRSLKKFENKRKNKHEVQIKLSKVQTCTTDLDLTYLPTQ